jgi:hypothetical protein
VDFPFIGEAYTSRSSNVNAQRCVNMYPEVDETGKHVIALYGTPGLTLKVTCAAGAAVRGMYATAAVLYIVCGAKLYSCTTGYALTERATLNTSSGVVRFAENPTQVMLVDGADGWIITKATNVATVISDVDFATAPTHVSFIDTYFIVNDSGTQRFYISSQNDGTAWDALDFSSADGAPDNNFAVFADHRELWLFGDESTEVFYNSGNDDFPFDRIQGAFIEQGIAAPHSVAKIDNSIFWLGKSRQGQGIVWRAEGYTPKRVSKHSIETAIQGYGTISDAIGWSQQHDGHSFYWLTFPTASKTWVYDAATRMWHERAYREPADSTLIRHRANAYAFFGGEHIVGDYEDGRIFELDSSVYADDGDEMLALRASQYFHDKEALAEIYHHRFQVDIESGVGLASGSGSDPQIILRWSDDGAHNWSNEHYADVGSFAAIGAIGEYRRRAIWNRLGKSRARVYEVSITDPVKRVFIAANVRATKGNS